MKIHTKFNLCYWWLGLMAIIALSGKALANNPELTWQPNNEPDIAGYKVSWVKQLGAYENSSDVGLQTSFVFPELEPGTYYAAVQAYDTAGQYSPYSDEVSFTVEEESAEVTLITQLLLHFGSQESQAYDLKEYFPLQVGDVRLYLNSETENGQTRWELNREPVSRTETIGEVETFVSGELSGGCWCEEYEARAWDSEGLKLYREVEYDDGELDVIVFDPPFLVVPRQLDLYETKEWTARWGDEKVELEMTLEAVESVTVFPGTVLACTFNNCLQTRWRWNSEDESEECHTWFAKGIGIVKEECIGTEDGETWTETMELVAAAVDHSLYGSPFRPWLEEWFSFYLAHISTSGCDMVMDNVVIALPGETSGLWWVKFTLNLDVTPIAWTITGGGQGTPPSLDPSSATACPIPGLDFSQALHKINIDNLTFDPQLWMRFRYEDKNYGIGFLFPPEKLSWDIYSGPDLVE